jgi:hypothetical protein
MNLNPEKKILNSDQNSDIGDDDWLNIEDDTPVNDDWYTPEQATEKTEDKPERKMLFAGEDREVTVKRSSGELEGGWEVVGPAKDGYVIVSNREQHKTKTIKTLDLLELQPFKKGETVTVLRSNGNVENQGWMVVEDVGKGILQVKNMEGKLKIVKKSDLVNAKMAELEIEREKQKNNGSDITRIEKEIQYWDKKLQVLNSINKEIIDQIFSDKKR